MREDIIDAATYEPPKIKVAPPVATGTDYNCVLHGIAPAVENDVGEPMCAACRQDIVTRAETIGAQPVIVPNWLKRYHKLVSIMKACSHAEGFNEELAARFETLVGKVIERLPPALRESVQQENTPPYAESVSASGMYFHRLAGRYVNVFDEYEQDFHEIPEGADYVKAAQERRKGRVAHPGTPDGYRFAIGKCTVEVRRLVRIKVEGEPHPDGFPFTPDDGGLVGRIIDKLHEDGILEAHVGGGMSGGGRHISFFDPDNGQLVAEWLETLSEAGHASNGEQS
jgi:hypothetical protein